MGKSNRIRAIRESEKAKLLGARNKKKGVPSWVLSFVAIALAAIVLVSSATILLSANGVFGSLFTVAKSEDYRLNANMVSYFYGVQYQNFYNSYGSYGIFSFDASKPHGDQPFGEGEESYDSMLLEGLELGEDEKIETWRDYFMYLAVQQIESVLVYCEAADEYEITLDDDDKKQIDDTIKEYADTAAEYGYTTNTFLALNFGEGVTERDVRKCMEYEILASKAAEKMGEDIEASIDTPMIDKAYLDGGKKFDIVNYTYYTFKVNYSDIVTKLGYTDNDLKDATKSAEVLAEYKKAITEAREAAAALKATTELQAFKDAIYKIVAEKAFDDQYKKTTFGADDKKAEDGSELIKDEDIANFKAKIVEQVLAEVKDEKEATVKFDTSAEGVSYFEYFGKAGVRKAFIDNMNKVQETVFSTTLSATTTYNVEKAGYVKDNKFSEWAFDDSRAVGNMEIYYQGDGAATDAPMGEAGKTEVDKIDAGNMSKTASVSVYFLTKTHEKDHEKSRDFSYIVFSKEEDAKAAIEAIRAGSITKDAFTAKGDELVSAGTATLVNTLENYEKGSFGSADLDDWLYDEATTAGSIMAAPVKITQDSSTVYVVGFYIGEGEELWDLDVKSSVFSDLSAKKDEELKATHEVKVNKNMLKDGFFKLVKVIGD